MELYDIPDFTGYKADKNGNIYSCIPKGCRNRFDKNKWLDEPKMMNPRILPNGYHRVYMRRDSTNKREDVYIHRVIATIFVPNPNNYPEVNHKDSDKNNNSANNLEWCTRRYNWDYAFSENGYRTRDELGRFTHK